MPCANVYRPVLMRCYWLFMLSDHGMAFCDWFLISLVFISLLTHHSDWNRGLQQLEQPITEYNCKHSNISTWHWEAPFTWSCSNCEAIYLALYLSQISLHLTDLYNSKSWIVGIRDNKLLVISASIHFFHHRSCKPLWPYRLCYGIVTEDKSIFLKWTFTSVNDLNMF